MIKNLNEVITNDALHYVQNIENNFVDMFLFSPPYSEIRSYNTDWSLNFNALGKEIYRSLKDGGVCAVVINDGTKNFAKSLTTARLTIDWCDNILGGENKDENFQLFEQCIYSRHGNPGAWWNKRFRVDHEYILLFFKGKRPKTFNKEPLMVESKHAGKIFSGTDRLTNGKLKKIAPTAVNAKKCRGTIWHYSTSNSEGNKLKLQHPASFPDKLAEDLILCFTEEKDIVCDCFSGSGTTACMAKKNNRNFLACDLSEEYNNIARELLSRI